MASGTPESKSKLFTSSAGPLPLWAGAAILVSAAGAILVLGLLAVSVILIVQKCGLGGLSDSAAGRLKAIRSGRWPDDAARASTMARRSVHWVGGEATQVSDRLVVRSATVVTVMVLA